MARVHSLLDEGKTYKEIALEFGVSDRTIQNRLKEETEKTEEIGRKNENTEKIPQKKQERDIDTDFFLHSNEEKTKAALPPTFDSIRRFNINDEARKKYGF